MIPFREPVPRTIGEMLDLLGYMMIASPTFQDPFFPWRNVATVFSALHEGLENLRAKLGDERFFKLSQLAREMRQLFEMDPDDQTCASVHGREMILEMERVIKER